jgi:hypothetical protein
MNKYCQASCICLSSNIKCELHIPLISWYLTLS